MNHQNGRKKLNMKSSYRTAYLRNQLIHLITYGTLKTTKANAREVKRFAEKIVTIARRGNNLTNRRHAESLLPYKAEALNKLFTEIAPRYTERPGGYTRLVPMGRRMSDLATISRLEWVL